MPGGRFRILTDRLVVSADCVDGPALFEAVSEPFKVVKIEFGPPFSSSAVGDCYGNPPLLKLVIICRQRCLGIELVGQGRRMI